MGMQYAEVRAVRKKEREVGHLEADKRKRDVSRWSALNEPRHAISYWTEDALMICKSVRRYLHDYLYNYSRLL